jgi:hypothetical protein
VRLHFKSDLPSVQEFRQWVKDEKDLAPEAPGALIPWWPGFKERLAAKARDLNTRLRRRRQAPDQATAAAAEALAAAETAVQEQGAVAVPGLVEAREQHTTAVMADGRRAALRDRVDWLHVGERPNPTITKRLQPGLSSRLVPALRDAAGQLHVNPRCLPDLVAQYWAGISSAPPTNQAAREQVLQAVRERVRPISPAAATSLGCKTVTEEEVKEALRQAKPGKAPGPDGIPIEAYRLARTDMIELLSKLYTAIGTTGVMPKDMMLGAISILHKSGSELELGNYRPLQLLNTDYRLMTKVLANRLSEVLSSTISMEQTAFLPGRQIGDNIMFLQLLPDRLRQLGRAAVIAFLDFRKAYDTVCRTFLLEVMEVMGVGQDFMDWVRMLFTNTTSVAVVNGFLSRPAKFMAGVKQGDPLSPALYLFVGQALLAWLQACDLGVELSGESTKARELRECLPEGARVPSPGPYRLTAQQFADDVAVLLRSLAAGEIQRFRTAMDTFAAASGQVLNLSKTELLPVGQVPQQDPEWQQTEVGGMRVVSKAKSLGVYYSNNQQQDPGAGADWEERSTAVKKTCTRIAGLHLSAFGRAFAASGYGISQVLYHAEFAGRPPEAVEAELQRTTRVLVDSGRVPGQRGGLPPRPRGIPEQFLCCHPTEGGFGALALKPHILARHARWALRYVRLVQQPVERRPAWVRVLEMYLQHSHPLVSAYGLLHIREGQVPVGPSSMYVGPVEVHPSRTVWRVLAGLRSLPPVGDVGRTVLQAGPWCATVTLWDNPLLEMERRRHLGAAVEPLNVLCRRLMSVPGLATVRDAVTLYRTVQARCVPHFYSGRPEAYRQEVWCPLLCRNKATAMMDQGIRDLLDCHLAVEEVTQLVSHIPRTWYEEAERTLETTGRDWERLQQEATRQLHTRLGWKIAAPDGHRTFSLFTLSVKDATDLQLQPFYNERLAAMQSFIQLAGPSACTVGQLKKLLTMIWQLKWENHRKELYWRLVCDGFPKYRAQECACGQTPACYRSHVFWECPIAEAVRTAIREGRPPADAGEQLERKHVWLMQTPRGIHSGVWVVVCLAALQAMLYGRTRAFGIRKAQLKALSSWQQDQAARQQAAQQQARVQRQDELQDASWRAVGVNPPPRPSPPAPVPQPPPPPPLVYPRQELLSRAGAIAVGQFWSLLADFVALQKLPAAVDHPMRVVITATHPFIAQNADGRVRVQLV